MEVDEQAMCCCVVCSVCCVCCVCCVRVVHRHGAILLIVRECSGFYSSADSTLWKLRCRTENK